MCFFFQPFFTVKKICVAKLTFSVGASHASLADASREIAFNVAENCLPFQTHHFPSDYCTSAAKTLGMARRQRDKLLTKQRKNPRCTSPAWTSRQALTWQDRNTLQQFWESKTPMDGFTAFGEGGEMVTSSPVNSYHVQLLPSFKFFFLFLT